MLATMKRPPRGVTLVDLLGAGRLPPRTSSRISKAARPATPTRIEQPRKYSRIMDAHDVRDPRPNTPSTRRCRCSRAGAQGRRAAKKIRRRLDLDKAIEGTFTFAASGPTACHQ